MLLGSALFLGAERVSETQTKSDNTQSKQDKVGPKIIALKSGEPEELTYDAGTVKFFSFERGYQWRVVTCRINGKPRLQNAHSPAHLYGRKLLCARRCADRQDRRQNV